MFRSKTATNVLGLCHSTPVVLRCLVALHYQVPIDPLILHTHGPQINAVLEWIYPGEPKLTFDSRHFKG